MNKDRYNIGLLVANITDEFSNSLAVGAMRAAKRLNADLVIFPGKYMGMLRYIEDDETKYEYQYNVLFDHAAHAKLDYVIAAVGTIASYTYDYEQKKKFLDGFGDTPVLSVAAKIEGYDYLQFENSSGILAAIDYLAAHGRKHIGIMAGDMNNYECTQRYEAYRKGLEKNGLEFKNGYMMTCEISPECRKEAERLIGSNPELDAVLCVNDKIAATVYDVLKEKGIKVGTDIAVIGFDNLPLCTELDPPMASVKANAELLGETAVEKAVNFLNGAADDRHYIDTEFIPRYSCYGHIKTSDPENKLFAGDIKAAIENINTYIRETSCGSDDTEKLTSVLNRFIEQLYHDYIENTADDAAVGKTAAFIEEISALMERSRLRTILNETYTWLFRSCAAGSISYVQSLENHFRPELSQESNIKIINEYEERTHFNNVFIRDSLMTDGSLTDSYAQILKKLCNVGAMTGFIYLFDKPVTYLYGDNFMDTSWLFTSYNYGAETFIVPKDQQLMRTPQVFSNDYLCAERQHIFIVADLFTAETQYGIALLEPRDERFFKDFELVTYQLSSAVRALDSLKNQNKLLTELHMKNLALEKISKIDPLTKVYNRRGFYPAAEELINDPEHQGKKYIICYADMDDLKNVNDTYGHIEGDYTIILMADCLKYALGERAIIARMGGDEFAAICPISEDVTAENVRSRKEKFIKEFNSSGKKPYHFDISIGVLECQCTDALDLRSIISRTDDLLYKEKSGKKTDRE